MQKIFRILILPLLIWSCGGNGEVKEKRDYILIKGEIANADNANIMLVSLEDKEEKLVDSTRVIDGKFELKTETKDLRRYVLVAGSQEMPILFFADESSDEINISGSLPGIGQNYTIAGTESGEEIKEYIDFLTPFFDSEQILYAQMQATPQTDSVAVKGIMAKLDSMSYIQRDYAIKKIKENPASPTNWVLLRELFPASGLAAFDTNDLAYFDEVATAMKEKYPSSTYPSMIERDVNSVRAQLVATNNPMSAPTAAGPPQEGDMAPEIELPDVNGNLTKLSDTKGQVVLLDFWASWCRPCRVGNPHVVKLYQQYKDKGFTVFSVSLDEDRNKWVSAIENDNLQWPSHVSDLQGWRSAAGAIYGVQSIPTTYLLDKTGRVVGINLRGVALEQKLQEVLG